MKIVDIKTTILRQPNVKPIADGIQDLLVIEVLTDQGIIGIGEVHTSPYIAKAIIEAPMSHVSAIGLKQILIGRNPLEREILWRDMYRYSSVYGRRGVTIHAISGIDIALWDILGKVTQMPAYMLMGGGYNQKVKAYASMLMPSSTEEVKKEVNKVVEEGFLAIKLGWGPLGDDVDSNLELISSIRGITGKEIDIMIDVGYGMEMNKALQMVKGLEEFNIFFLEEPLSPDNLEGFARLSLKTDIAIATGEKETTYYGFRDLIRIGKVDIIQPDIARVGGLTESKKILDLATKEGITCIPHCWSSDILLSATLQLVSCIPSIPYIEYCTLETPLRTSVCQNRIKVVDGYVEIPDLPGIGAQLNEETLNSYFYNH